MSEPQSREVAPSAPHGPLRYRRQFVLGPAFADDAPGWTRLTVTDRARVTAHPDLETCQVSDGRKSITLLGYLLDPDHPEAGNEDIVRGLLTGLDSFHQVCERTARLGGRWALVVCDGRDTVVLHDAAGLRQVYYARPEAGSPVVCASQAGLVAKTLGLPRDPDALAFMESRGNHVQGVYWMPGDTTLYGPRVRALLPNRYLDLTTGETHRYWPTGATTTLEGTVDECARVLRGLTRAARNRRRLSVAMTAGWDSRLMLALSREVAAETYYFTLTYPDDRPDARDLTVPTRLLGRLGLPLDVLRCPEAADPAFRDVCRLNADAVKDTYTGDTQLLHERYPADHLCVTGDVAEIAKCFYRLPAGETRAVTAHDLGAFTTMGDHPFVLAAFARWLDEAPRGGVDILDLFSWEQVAGRWQALIRSDNDIVYESFAALNCRYLLELLLSMPEARRRPPRYEFFRELIGLLWADVLTVPINPREPLRARNVAGWALRKLGLYDLVRNRLRRSNARAPGHDDPTVSKGASR